MHMSRFTIVTAVWLGLSAFWVTVGRGFPADSDSGGAQAGAKSDPSDRAEPQEKSDTGKAAKKAPEAGKAPKKKSDRGKSSRKTSDTDLSMEPGIVCKSIDGYDSYEPLPGAAQTADEKLLIYIRADGFKTEKAKGAYEGHLGADFEIRRRDAKAILLQKKKILDYKPRGSQGRFRVFLKGAISLKGLNPGDYDLTIILHDENDKGSSTSQVIKFKVIPPDDLSKKQGDETAGKLE
jgi:hypothetical protein